MCVSIQKASRVTDPWDADRGVITIPENLTGDRETRAIRTVLEALDVPQPATGARCWCGLLLIGGKRIPEQRGLRSVIARGA